MAIEGETLTLVLTIGGAAASVIAAAASLSWWLAAKFAEVRKMFYKVLDAHEVLDQRRHEENLSRFERIHVALAQLGFRAGGQGG